MRLEFSSNESAVSLAENEFDQSAPAVETSADVTEMLRGGIKAAQNGNRSEARNLLLRVTEADPKNENAWLWLASISEYPEELLVFLNNVLDINPVNERALEWAKATKSLLAKNLVQRGIEAEKENRREVARQCFMQAVIHDNRNEMAWLWLASIAGTSEEKTAHLHRVLEINPENETALESLKPIKEEVPQSLLSKACEAAVDGDYDSANSFLEEILEKSPELESAWLLKAHMATSFKEKAEYFEKVLEFNAESLTAQVNLEFFRGLWDNAEAAVETNIEDRELSFEPATEEQLSDDTTPPMMFSEETPAEVEAVFGENSENSEDFGETQVTNGSFFEEIVSEENFWETVTAGAESEAEIETFQSKEEVLTENQFDDEYLFESDFAETEDENVVESSETAFEEIFERTEVTEIRDAEQFAEPELNSFDDEEEFSHSSAENYTEQTEENYTEREAIHQASNVEVVCPFCRADNEPQSFVCRWCSAMLSLSNMEMLLAHDEADTEIVRQAIEEIESEAERRELNPDELVNLGIGYINLKHLRKGLSVLQKAAKLDSNNVVLESQVNSLAIRLSEIEEKQSNHQSMPKDKTIMVVDDSATVRKLISGKLEKCGHIVVTAIDGMDAMEKLGDITPDLILLDIAMPRMDGYQVCKLIRNNESTKDIPIVMISGKDGFFDKVRGRMSGTTNYITKPFGPETLMKMLETYLV